MFFFQQVVLFHASCSLEGLLACMCVWQTKREGVNCTNPLLWRLLLYRGKQMLWVELQPVWRIHSTGGCVCGHAAACHVRSCVFMWGHLPQTVCQGHFSRPGWIGRAFSWMPDSSLWRTTKWTLTGRAGMAGNDEKGGTLRGKQD